MIQYYKRFNGWSVSWDGNNLVFEKDDETKTLEASSIKDLPIPIDEIKRMLAWLTEEVGISIVIFDKLKTWIREHEKDEE